MFGLAIGIGIAQAARLVVPALPVHTPIGFVALAELPAVGSGLAAACCRRGAHLGWIDPVQALRAE